MGHVRNSPGSCVFVTSTTSTSKGGRHRKSERHTRSVGYWIWILSFGAEHTRSVETCLPAYRPRSTESACSSWWYQSQEEAPLAVHLAQSEIFLFERGNFQRIALHPALLLRRTRPTRERARLDYDLLELNDISNSFLMANVRYLVSPAVWRKKERCALFCATTRYIPIRRVSRCRTITFDSSFRDSPPSTISAPSWSKVCVILDFASFLLDFFLLLRELNWFILIYGMLWLEITI